MLPRAWAGQDAGGAGLSASESAQIAEAAGAFALAVPLVETMVAHHWAARADIALPDGPVTLAPAALEDAVTLDDAGRLSGNLRDIPWTQGPLLVAVNGQDHIRLALISASAINPDVHVTHDGSPRACLAFSALQPDAMGQVQATLQDVVGSAAVMRSAQIAGALRSVMNLAVDYAGERKAFGRVIGKFQAVQQNLAILAGETCSAEVAARVGAMALDRGSDLLATAGAKIRADEAADEGAALAHQVFGAIGFTDEHVLHRYTTRLHAWRDDFGTGGEWATQLGHHLTSHGSETLWSNLSDGDLTTGDAA